MISPERATASRSTTVAALLRETAEPFDSIEHAELGPLLDRIGDARVVLLGEASHGSSEFYRMRARVTQELVQQRGFNIVAVEADWPDAGWIDRYVRHAPEPPGSGEPFVRFPTWMWRNRDVAEFAEWLRQHNGEIRHAPERVGFYGLDLYSMYGSIAAVLDYLERVDPPTAKIARERYGCLTPWARDPAAYGHAALTQAQRSCEGPVVAMLMDLLKQRFDYARRDGERFMDAVQNARLVANAERYYRAMYHGSVVSWNLRDQHMFDTLSMLLGLRPAAKAVVWEHNSHIGNAAATEMGARGEHNVGQLSRESFGDEAYLVGFGTDHGTVAAASNWDEPMQVMHVRAAHPDSYERICHETGLPAFLLPLREPVRAEVREELAPPRLERAIGVVYRPHTELESHYFQASLPYQFDEYVWLDRTAAVTPLPARQAGGVPDTYPFGV
jgi:protein-L-isoaspartate(D-aspartate) O-methyltransferase